MRTEEAREAPRLSREGMKRGESLRLRQKPESRASVPEEPNRNGESTDVDGSSSSCESIPSSAGMTTASIPNEVAAASSEMTVASKISGVMAASSISTAAAAASGMTFAARLKRRSERMLDRARAAVKHAALQQSKAEAVVEIESADRVRDISYQDQGDADLSTAEAFQQRQRLRRSHEVLSELQEWWHAARATARRVRPSATSLLEEDYCCIFVELYRDLLGADGYDEVDAEREAHEEWRNDSCEGGSGMQREHFLASIFELCDVYERSIAAVEYARFLRELLHRVRNSDGTIGKHKQRPHLPPPPPPPPLLPPPPLPPPPATAAAAVLEPRPPVVPLRAPPPAKRPLHSRSPPPEPPPSVQPSARDRARACLESKHAESLANLPYKVSVGSTSWDHYFGRAAIWLGSALACHLAD